MDSLDLIKSLNPNLANGTVMAEEYDVLVVGRRKAGADGAADIIKFTERTKPTPAAKAAGVVVQPYLRVSFTRSGAVIAGESGEDSFKGSKKAQAGNVFKNTQTNLYAFLKQKLDAGQYDIVDDIIEPGKEGATIKRPVARVKATVWGAKISLTVPKYKLMTKTADGKRVALKGAKYNPKTDSYEKNAARTAIVLRFFADIDDLEELESLAVSQYERFVAPYEVEEKTTITKTTNKQVIEKELEAPTDGDPELDPDLDLDDDDTDDSGN